MHITASASLDVTAEDRIEDYECTGYGGEAHILHLSLYGRLKAKIVPTDQAGGPPPREPGVRTRRRTATDAASLTVYSGRQNTVLLLV